MLYVLAPSGVMAAGARFGVAAPGAKSAPSAVAGNKSCGVGAAAGPEPVLSGGGGGAMACVSGASIAWSSGGRELECWASVAKAADIA